MDRLLSSSFCKRLAALRIGLFDSYSCLHVTVQAALYPEGCRCISRDPRHRASMVDYHILSYGQGDDCHFRSVLLDDHAIESNWRIRKVRILSISGEFATIHFVYGEGGTRLRLSRLYKTKEEAAANMRKKDKTNAKIALKPHFRG